MVGMGNKDDYLKKVIEAFDSLEVTSPDTTATSLAGFQPAIWSFPANRPEEEQQNDLGTVTILSLPHHTELHHNGEVTMPDSLCPCAAFLSCEMGQGSGCLTKDSLLFLKSKWLALQFYPSVVAELYPPYFHSL